MSRRSRPGWRAVAVGTAALAVAAGLLVGIARSPAWPDETLPPGTRLYRSAATSLPPWAQPGSFRFVRLDGGGIESRKAERTWWGRSFTATEKRVLANVYSEHLDQMLGLLREARINWIWVTWSNGWSFREEAENRAALRRVIAAAHAAGIQVTAYLSASNMFWRSTFRDEPQSRDWLIYWHGLPVPYGGSPHRLLADVGKPQWRAYLRAKTALALDAGADGVFFDNIFGGKRGNQALLSEIQWLAEAKAREHGRAKALVYANVHPAPERFDLNDHCDLVWDESGTHTPGVWDDGFYVGNVRKIKFLAGEKQPWQPLKFENDWYHCGPRETCIPTPAEQQVGIAEAYAFGAALSRNLEGRFLAGLVAGEPAALEAWSAIAQYHRFIAEHAWLYHAEPVARVGLVSRAIDDRLADDLVRGNVMFQTKVLGHLDRGPALATFRTLVVPFAPRDLDATSRRLLGDFARHGGRILAADAPALRRQLADGGSAAVAAAVQQSASLVSRERASREAAPEIAHVSGGPVVALEHGPNVVAQVTRRDGTATFVVHLINYDLRTPVENLRVRVDLGDYVADAAPYTVSLLSPDGADGPAPQVSRAGGEISFAVPRIRHYAVAVITRGRPPEPLM